MEIRLSERQMAQIIEHCEQAYPNEGCGVLLGRMDKERKTVVDVFPTGNARESEAQHNRYLIPIEDMMHSEELADERNLEVVGYFHSHPDHPAKPSVFDREHAWPVTSYLITSVKQGQAQQTRSWVLRDDRSAFDEETMTTTNGHGEQND